ncbi:GNAT family N-acetyltransferase [Massilia sp. W12]|uniref:GNAT family N-acetyltransferase n=1 Tax=Massilia sp. W12 TaxID=3126507 RepID=UPI0030CC2EC6
MKNDFALHEGTFADRAVLDRLAELYLYDYSEFDGYDVDAHGLYRFDDLDYYWLEKTREVLLFKVNQHWAGFALISEDVLHPQSQRCINDFFILRKYRRQGIGAQAANCIFARTPSAWEVCMLPNNLPAQAFWRKTIAAASNGAWQEQQIDNDDWRGPLMWFDNRPQT